MVAIDYSLKRAQINIMVKIILKRSLACLPRVLLSPVQCLLSTDHPCALPIANGSSSTGRGDSTGVTPMPMNSLLLPSPSPASWIILC